jgi:hypothetical protein
MNEKRKKFISLFLVFSLVALSGNLMGKERKGANLTIQKIDGQEVMGELIAVKKDSLLLLDAETNSDITIQITDVKAITIRKKSRMLELGLLGALGGAAAQGLVGKTSRTSSNPVDDDENIASHTQTSFVLYGAIVGCVGLLLGAVIGMNKKIKIEGKSDVEIDAALKKLSKKARVPNYQ